MHNPELLDSNEIWIKLVLRFDVAESVDTNGFELILIIVVIAWIFSMRKELTGTENLKQITMIDLTNLTITNNF